LGIVIREGKRRGGGDRYVPVMVIVGEYNEKLGEKVVCGREEVTYVEKLLRVEMSQRLAWI